MRAWILTDGTAEDEDRCLGVAEAVADRIERRRVAPRAPWRWLAPWGPIDPRDKVEHGSGPIALRPGELWPDVAIAAGRLAAPYLGLLKKASSGAVVTAFLGDGHSGLRTADVIWVRDSDRLRGPNVIATATGPHRLNRVRLAAARGGPRLVEGGRSVGVLLGDAFDGRPGQEEDVARLLAGLRRLRADGWALLVRPSRSAREPLRMALDEVAHHVWDGVNPDPTVAVLAQADAFLVSADAPGAIEAAASTGAPIMIFRPSGLPRRLRTLADRLTALGLVRPFSGRIEAYAYAPRDATSEIARAVSALAAARIVLKVDNGQRVAARARETNGPGLR